nr:hypothetical protein [Actinomycetota bacterium]
AVPSASPSALDTGFAVPSDGPTTPPPASRAAVAAASSTASSGGRLNHLIALVLGAAVLLGIGGATGLYLTREGA